MTPEQIAEVARRSTRLIDEREVEAALDSMAVSINSELADKNPLVICIMHGGLITSGKLATRFRFSATVRLSACYALPWRNQWTRLAVEGFPQRVSQGPRNSFNRRYFGCWNNAETDCRLLQAAGLRIREVCGVNRQAA